MKDLPEFTPFDPHKPVQVYHRNLPHWRQKGVTYFVTFRLADSIPLSVLLAWQDERRRWMSAHHVTNDTYASIPLKERRKFERRMGSLLHIELDRAYGCCLLKKKVNARLLSSSLTHFHGVRCWTGDFVVMPNHVHLLLCPFDGFPLEKLMQSVKLYCSRRLDDRDQMGGRVFQPDSYDRIVRNREELAAYRKYIEGNGHKAGLSADQYLYHRCDWL